MFTQEISLKNWGNTEIYILIYHFELLLKYYRMNGQIMSDCEPLFFESNFIKCNVSTLETDSLSAENNTNNIKMQIRKIENLLLASATATLQNHVPVLDEIPICICKKSDSYILTASSLFKMSPISCGNCGGQIPIYKVVGLSQEFKESLVDWQKNYECCDHLVIGGFTGEAWSIEQMASYDSDLSRIGINLCNELYGDTKIPTFYPILENIQKGIINDKLKTCPKCKGEWYSYGTKLNSYLRCNKCNLMKTGIVNDFEVIEQPQTHDSKSDLIV